jgi:hypothetical protein
VAPVSIDIIAISTSSRCCAHHIGFSKMNWRRRWADRQAGNVGSADDIENTGNRRQACLVTTRREGAAGGGGGDVAAWQAVSMSANGAALHKRISAAAHSGWQK